MCTLCDAEFLVILQPSRTTNQKRNGGRLKPMSIWEAPKSRKVSRTYSNEATQHQQHSLPLKGDSLAEEEGGDEEEEEDEELNKDGSASEDDQNGDGENDDA